MNNITEQGIYYCANGTPQNAPIGWATYIVLKGANDGYKLQFALSRSNTAKVYYRVKVGINDWDDWAQFYNQAILTDSTILAPLASALGVSKFIIGWQGTPLQSSVFAFTFGTTDGSSIILDIQLYDVNGASSYITISHTKWNTDSWIGMGKNDLLTVKKKNNVMYISQSGGGGYGFVKFRYQGDMSVSLQKVSEIPSDATDIAFQ